MQILKTPAAYAALLINMACGNVDSARVIFWNGMRAGDLARMPASWLWDVDAEIRAAQEDPAHIETLIAALAAQDERAAA